MTEDRDVELARSVLERMGLDGPESVLDEIHDDFEMTTPEDLASEPQTYRGREGFLLWWEQTYEVMDEVRLETQEMVQGAPGRVACRFQLIARGHASGVEVSQQAALVSTMVDEKLRRVDFFTSFEDAVAAAGAQ